MAGNKRFKGDGKGRQGGRKKGTPNKNSGVTKDALAQIVLNNVEKVQKMLDMIVEPRDFVMTWVKVAEFVLPKMSSVALDATVQQSDLKSELAAMEKEES